VSFVVGSILHQQRPTDEVWNLCRCSVSKQRNSTHGGDCNSFDRHDRWIQPKNASERYDPGLCRVSLVDITPCWVRLGRKGFGPRHYSWNRSPPTISYGNLKCGFFPTKRIVAGTTQDTHAWNVTSIEGSHYALLQCHPQGNARYSSGYG
jgi:hypothetical protein